MHSDPMKLTRRNALARALGVVGMMAVGGQFGRGEKAPEATTDFKLGCGTVSFRTKTLEEALERIRRAGYEFFETQGTGAWCPHVDPWKGDPNQFQKLVRD